MWDSPSSDSSIYRSIQFSLAIDRIITLLNLGYKPANMTVREIYKASQESVDIQPKYSIMDSARIKQVANQNSFISD